MKWRPKIVIPPYSHIVADSTHGGQLGIRGSFLIDSVYEELAVRMLHDERPCTIRPLRQRVDAAEDLVCYGEGGGEERLEPDHREAHHG